MGLDYMKTPSAILKVVQILLVIIALSVFRGVPGSFSGNNLNDGNVFGSGVLVASLIITPVLLAVNVIHENHPKNFLELIMNSLLGLFFLAAGSDAINYWRTMEASATKDASLTTGCFCLFASFAYIGNAVINILELRGAEAS